MIKSKYEQLQENYLFLKSKYYYLLKEINELNTMVSKHKIDEIIRPCMTVILGSSLALTGYTGNFILDTIFSTDNYVFARYIKLFLLVLANSFLNYSLYRTVKFLLFRR